MRKICRAERKEVTINVELTTNSLHYLRANEVDLLLNYSKGDTKRHFDPRSGPSSTVDLT
jgi:hypothetical protein